MRRQMDYLSDSEASDDQQNEIDIQRLQAAWNNVKQKRQSQKKSVGSVKNAIHLEQQKNLQARLSLTQKQLSKARENTALLMKKLSQAQQELEIREFELNKQKKTRQEQQFQIQQLKLLLAKRAKQQTFGFQKQNISQNNRQTDALRKKLQIKQKQIERLCLKIKSLELDKTNNNNQLKNLVQLNQNYKRQLAESQTVMNEVYLGEQSKGAQLLQLDQAQKAIERLIYILKNTQQFKLLGQFAQQAKDLHFLKNITKRLKTGQLNHRVTQKQRLCTCMDLRIDQRLLWTTQASYKTMLELKIKYQSLTEDCIQQVLFELNKIWLAREESRVKKLKQYYEGQINKLKKKGQQRYDEMVARKQIQRLKKQLTGVKNAKKNGRGVTMDELKNIGQYEDEIRIRNKQIRLLQQRIRLLQTQTNSSDRALYLQGALWIMQKVLGELQINDDDLRQFESEFRQKIQGNLSTDEWLRSFKQFFQTITQINSNLVERLFAMRQSTLKKVSGEKNISFKRQ